MRKNAYFSTSQLLLTATLFVAAAAIITGTILGTYTTTVALAAKTTTKEKTTANDDTNKPISTSINEKQKQELITAPSIPFTTPSPSTTAITPELSSPTTSTKSSSTTSVTTQSLSSVKALQTNNIVNTKSYYDIIFKTGTTATIGKIDITFPSGTSISSRVTVEASGIGSGSTSTSGSTLTYTVSSPLSISSGKTIRLEFGGIGNPSTASANLAVTVTTKTSDGTVIEGPATSSAYSIKQIGTNDIANGAITGTKITGTSKLVFVQCTASETVFTQPTGIVGFDCQTPTVAHGDGAVATMNELGPSNGCFKVVGAQPEDGFVRFFFQNGCDVSLIMGSTNVSAIVFKST
jgi:hypothetical protein